MSIAEKLTIIAENEQRVYDAGYNKGKAEGGGGNTEEAYNQGYENALDEFWGEIQNHGQSKNYAGAFSSNAWDDNTFNPRFDFICTAANTMFQYSKMTKLKEKLDAKKLKIDTSACSQVNQMFQGAKIKDVPLLDIQKATYINYMFGSLPSVETIDGLIFSETTGTNSTAFMFDRAMYLTHCIFYGTVAVALDISACKLLDKESISTLVNALSTTKSGLTTTLSLQAVNKAFETSEGANDGKTSSEWTSLVATKTNWTFAYN